MDQLMRGAEWVPIHYLNQYKFIANITVNDVVLNKCQTITWTNINVLPID